MSDDRTVHASDARGGIEIVRYNRAGKWYCEIKENVGRVGLPAERQHIGVRQAAEQAKSLESRGGTIFIGRPGGQAFDRLVDK